MTPPSVIATCVCWNMLITRPRMSARARLWSTVLTMVVQVTLKTPIPTMRISETKYQDENPKHASARP